MNENHYWRAVQERDGTQDGRFYYGVVTTGIYCRPSCASRLPLRRNVRFYTTPAQAEVAGLRPCKRCRPLLARADACTVDTVLSLCRHIETLVKDGRGQSQLTLQALSRHGHLSPFHLQRRFKAALGVTPRQYAEAYRLQMFRSLLRAQTPITQAIHAAGFGSTSRVYERAAMQLGMTPRQYRAGGAGFEISYASTLCPLGMLMMAATDRGLCFVQFAEVEAQLLDMLRCEYPRARLRPMSDAARPAFDAWMLALGAYLDGSCRDLDLPLDLCGTAFQMRVWRYLQQIPYGETKSYRQVAQAIGVPGAVRAVGGACAANKVALLVPCHRVIRGDGGLGGYRWGLARKRALLDKERARYRVAE